MPQIWQVDVRGEPGYLPSPRHLHAVVSQWLDTADAAGSRPDGIEHLATNAGHRDREKPWSIGAPEPTATGLTLTVRLLRDDLQASLTGAAPAEASVEFGKQPSGRREWTGTVTSAPTPLVCASWHDIENGEVHNAWAFDLITPTVFHSGNNYHPHPTPEVMLRSLTDRWNTWRQWDPSGRPSATPVSSLRLPARAFLTDYITGESQLLVPTDPRRPTTRRESRPEPRYGFVGTIAIRCTDPGARRTLSLLARWSQFTGVGAMTTYGHGVTRIRPWSST